MNTDTHTADCIGKVQPEHKQENAIGHFTAKVLLKRVTLTGDSNICCVEVTAHRSRKRQCRSHHCTLLLQTIPGQQRDKDEAQLNSTR